LLASKAWSAAAVAPLGRQQHKGFSYYVADGTSVSVGIAAKGRRTGGR